MLRHPALARWAARGAASPVVVDVRGAAAARDGGARRRGGRRYAYRMARRAHVDAATMGSARRDEDRETCIWQWMRPACAADASLGAVHQSCYWFSFCGGEQDRALCELLSVEAFLGRTDNLPRMS